MNVAIYTRVSTDEQKEHGFSLQDQERRLRKKCRELGKSIVAHYQDDYSAKDFRRPEFHKLLLDIKNRNISIKELWCVRMDRFSRNVFESLKMIEYLRGLGVTLRFLENDIDLTIPENLIAYMLNMVMPQVENERRGLNTKQGLRQAMRLGRWVWKAPKGYINNTRDKTIEVTEDAKFIRKAFEEVSLNQRPIDTIRKELNFEGFKCSKQQFYNLLRNHFYIGKIKIDAWKDEPEEIVVGNHKPIISEALFNKVQLVLSGNKRRQSTPNRTNVLFPLRGRLICKRCGNNLTASTSKGRNKRYSYYHCQNGCKERFSSELANNLLIKELEKLSITESLAELYEETMRDIFKNKERSKKKKLEGINYRLQKEILKKDKLDEDYLSQEIDTVQFNRLTNKLESRISILNEELEACKRKETNLEKYFRNGLFLITNLGKHYQGMTIEVKQQLIDSIYPEKLIFTGEKYRTYKLNTFIALVANNHSGLKNDLNKKAAKNGGLSNWAPPAGLEPATL
ncbi:recombinase family protein [Flagellimonas meishanensis]|uniref:recombinase family protein n=1 Tax=Flagellimonas meishanensis TaxID=2873264 RepID=UPI001CA7080E|nr:recombinase family protein [[Muricauda] meishanensis]